MAVLAYLYATLSSPHALKRNEVTGLHTVPSWSSSCHQDLDFFVIDAWASETEQWLKKHRLTVVKLAEVILPDFALPALRDQHHPVPVPARGNSGNSRGGDTETGDEQNAAADHENEIVRSILQKTSGEFLKFAERMLKEHVFAASASAPGATVDHAGSPSGISRRSGTSSVPARPKRLVTAATALLAEGRRSDTPPAIPGGVGTARRSTLPIEYQLEVAYRVRESPLPGRTTQHTTSGRNTPSTCSSSATSTPLGTFRGETNIPWLLRIRAKERDSEVLAYSEAWRKIHKWGNHVPEPEELKNYAEHLQTCLGTSSCAGGGGSSRRDGAMVASRGGSSPPGDRRTPMAPPSSAAPTRAPTPTPISTPAISLSRPPSAGSPTASSCFSQVGSDPATWQRDLFLHRIPTPNSLAAQVQACSEQIGPRRCHMQANNFHCLLHAFESRRVAELLEVLSKIVARFDAFGLGGGAVWLAKDCFLQKLPEMMAEMEGRKVVGLLRGSDAPTELRPVFTIPAAEDFYEPPSSAEPLFWRF